MNINPINRINNITARGVNDKTPQKKSANKSDKLIKELNKMSMINNVNIGKKDFELNLSME